jgi:hypothetical protein
VIILEYMLIKVNDVIKPILDGIEPLILLFPPSKYVTLPKLPISDGRLPESTRPLRLIAITLA